jgi:5'-methylthioadenosine phosphorylase
MQQMRPDVGVLGGSGLYALLEDAEEVRIDTPYGPPSDPVTVGRVGDRRVAFLPRRRRDHRFPAHTVPYRANLWALRSLGVRQVLTPCAVGSLRAELGPGSIVVPDQLVDRTFRREPTFHDSGAMHVPFADPYCPVGRRAVLTAATARQEPAVDGATMVVIEGPRFSTRAESVWYAAQGWALVNMTGLPEAVLARELAMCYTSIALVTDLDAGVSAGGAVTQQELFRTFADNIRRVRGLVLDTAARLPAQRQCLRMRALDGADVALPLP